MGTKPFVELSKGRRLSFSMCRTYSRRLNMAIVVLLPRNRAVAATSIWLVAERDDFPRGTFDATAVLPKLDHKEAHNYYDAF